MYRSLSRCISIVCSSLLFLTQIGCSTYLPASLPRSGEPDGESSGRPTISVGSNVRVFCTDGSVLSGEVVRITETELVIENVGNYGVENQTVFLDSIARVEVDQTPKRSSHIALGAILLAAVTVVYVVVTLAVAGAHLPNT